jgi:hypothetical protein
MNAGVWTTGVVTKDLEPGTYVVNHGSMIMYINQRPANIRAHQMTPAEKAAADQSAQAFAKRPTGNGIGAEYAGRELATCKSRTAPPNAETAREYLLCDMEGLDGFQNLLLLTDVTVQLAAPRRFIYTQDSDRSQIDVRAPVCDIRGGFKEYQCGKPILGAAPTRPHTTATYMNNRRPPDPATRILSGTGIARWPGNRPAGAKQVREQMPPK